MKLLLCLPGCLVQNCRISLFEERSVRILLMEIIAFGLVDFWGFYCLSLLRKSIGSEFRLLFIGHFVEDLLKDRNFFKIFRVSFMLVINNHLRRFFSFLSLKESIMFDIY